MYISGRNSVFQLELTFEFTVNSVTNRIKIIQVDELILSFDLNYHAIFNKNQCCLGIRGSNIHHYLSLPMDTRIHLISLFRIKIKKVDNIINVLIKRVKSD